MAIGGMMTRLSQRLLSTRSACVIALVVSASCGRANFDVLAAVDGEIDGPAVVPIAKSCRGLATTCGATRTGACCDSPLVPGGTFARGYDVGTDGLHPDASFPATLSDFRLDTYEVTVGRYRAFVAAGQGTQASPPSPGAGAHPDLPGSGWDASWTASLVADSTALVAAVNCEPMFQTWTEAPGSHESLPVTCVSWFEAVAFCAWDGGYLPTETEWNYAASGGDEQRAYPWSSPPSSLAVDDTRASWNCTGDGANGCTAADTLVVGSKPAGAARWGQSDLAGNAWEWTLDWKAPYANPCTDCGVITDTAASSVRVVRGGSWGDAAFNLRGSDRGTVRAPVVREDDLGFRCARAP